MEIDRGRLERIGRALIHEARVEVSTEKSLLGMGSEITTLALEWVAEENDRTAGEDDDAGAGADAADSA